MPLYVGIDLSRASLDVAAGALRFRVPNTPKGHAELLKRVRALKRQCHFVSENDGSNGRKLYALLHSKRCRLSCVSAYRVRQFAKAMGREAKTDALDAIMLGEYGRVMKPEPTPQPRRIDLQLEHMVRRRIQIKKMIHSHDCRAAELWDNRLKASATKLQEFLKHQLTEIEELIAEVIASDPVLAAKKAAICTVSGIADISASQIIAELPELGCMDRRRLAAIAGLAPINRDSGSVPGRRSIKGGRFYLRQALYMPAMVAIKLNPVLKPYYEKLRAAGKPFRVALVAVMRKLLIHLNSIARDAVALAPSLIKK